MNLDNMSKNELIDTLNSFVSAAMSNYKETEEEAKKDEFQAGRQLAYFEMLDMLRSRIKMNNGQMDTIEPPI